MADITQNVFECLDCGRTYARPMAFVDGRRSAQGCPSCGSIARRKKRRWFHWARDFAILMNTQ